VSKVVVTTSVTLDGVMQAPGMPEEDVRGGFDRGGWAAPYNDAAMAQKMGEGMAQTGAMLFGRRTYEGFFESWAHRMDGNPFTEMMNNVQKYVASSTLTEPLP
jgi:dihydrofolate reductase